MTFAEPGGFLVAVWIGLSFLAAYVMYRMGREGVDGLRRMMAFLRSDRRGDRR